MNLNVQISALKTQLKQRDARILKLTRELKEARRFINALTRSDDVYDDEMDWDEEEDEEDGSDKDDEYDDDENEESDNDEEEEEPDGGLPQVLILDNVYACCSCGTEVLEGTCHKYECGMEHQWPPSDPLYEDYSIGTDSLATHPDRSLVPRGDTPVRGLGQTHSAQPPDEYRYKRASLWQPERPDRSVEYRELIKRGATRLMCETFHLEYTHKGGIYAWADSDIFDEFSGPLMKQGDTWKIHLGRRITLEEGDVDGSTFIEDLLEDTVVFSSNIEGLDPAFNEWETKEETPGVWVTRMKADVKDEEEQDELDELDEWKHGDLTSDPFYKDTSRYEVALDLALEQPPAGGAIALNEYLSDSDSGQEEDPVQPSDVMSEDDDDYASQNSSNSDSEDVEVHDTAFTSFAGPDRVWDSDMDDSSEGEDLQLLDGRDTS